MLVLAINGTSLVGVDKSTAVELLREKDNITFTIHESQNFDAD